VFGKAGGCGRHSQVGVAGLWPVGVGGRGPACRRASPSKIGMVQLQLPLMGSLTPGTIPGLAYVWDSSLTHSCLSQYLCLKLCVCALARSDLGLLSLAMACPFSFRSLTYLQ
jgi:hypothetical protein